MAQGGGGVGRACEWSVRAKEKPPGRRKPTGDTVAGDGQKVTPGDTTVTFNATPRSTPGNYSAIFPLKDGSQRNVGGMIGGDFMRIVQEGIQLFPYMKTMSTGYIAPSKRYKELSEEAGVDAIIHTHAEYDGTFEKIEALRSRKPGEPHPFVSKDDVERFNTMHIEGGEAQLAWAKQK